MEIVAGIDIGNATTEVALAKIQNNKIFSGILFFLFRFIMIPPSRQIHTNCIGENPILTNTFPIYFYIQNLYINPI